MSVTLASADDPMFGLLRVLTDDGDLSGDPGVDDASSPTTATCPATPASTTPRC